MASMNKSAKLLFALSLLCVFKHGVNCAKMPDYLTKCVRSDSSIEDCLKKNIKSVFTNLADKGDSALKLQQLEPVVIDYLSLSPTPTLNMTFQNAKFYGLSNMEITTAEFKDDTIKLNYFLANLVMVADYEANGNLLILPFEGKGACNLTISNLKGDYKAKLKLKERKGKQYYHLESHEQYYEPDSVVWHIDNLFNGNKQLGDEMNRFINENWKEVFDEVRPGINLVYLKIFEIYVRGFFHNIPSNEIVA